MISLRSALEGADRLGQQKSELVRYYTSAIEIFSRHAIEVPADTPSANSAANRNASKSQEAQQAAAQLKALHDALLKDDSSESLDTSLAAFENCVRGYSDGLRSALAGAKQDVRLVLELLRDATRAMESSNHRVGSDLSDFTSRIQETIDTNDLTRIREALSAQVLSMKGWISSLRTDTDEQLSPLQAQLRVFEERLQNAEYQASTDPLTKLWNRREGERLVQMRIVKQCPCSLLVIDLNRFKFINDEYGHQCGDRVLQFVAAKLSECVRPTDSVCRWGGDEFVVLLDCGLDIARRRATQLGEQIEGHFLFESQGRITAVPVSASIGVATYEHGDSFDDVFQRADAEMYRRKRDQADVYAAEIDPNRASVYTRIGAPPVGVSPNSSARKT
jgi:diguanylate cyclase (GGDEF)-like protein